MDNQKVLIQEGWYRLKDEILEGSLNRFDGIYGSINQNGEIIFNAEEFKTFKNGNELTHNVFSLWNYYYDEPDNNAYNQTGIQCYYNDINTNYECLSDLGGPEWWGTTSNYLYFTKEQYIDIAFKKLLDDYAVLIESPFFTGSITLKNTLQFTEVYNGVTITGFGMSCDSESILVYVSVDKIGAEEMFGIQDDCTLIVRTGYEEDAENPLIVYLGQYGWLDGSLTLADLLSGEDYSSKIISSDKYRTISFDNVLLDYNYKVWFELNKIEKKAPILIKNPICLIGSKAKKVVVDNINMTIDVWTKEVPSEEMYFYLENKNILYSFSLPKENITFKELFLNYGTIITYSSNEYYIYNSHNSIGCLNIDKYDIDNNRNIQVHIGTYSNGYYGLPGSSFNAYLNDVIIPGYAYTFTGGGSND